MFCPRCGKRNLDDFRFCADCGGALPALDPAPAAPAPAPAPPAATVTPLAPPPAPAPAPGASGCLVAAIVGGLLLVFVLVIGAAGAFVWYRSKRAPPPPPRVSTLPIGEVPEPHAPPPAVAVAEPPPPPPPPPVLTTIEPGRLRYAPPDDDASVSIYLDNGLDGGVVVKLDGAAEVTVDSRERVRLQVAPGRIRLEARDAAGTPLDDLAPEVERHGTYIYNPSAAWDYTIGFRTYSTMPAMTDFARERTESVVAVTFFRAEVAFPFEDFPETIKILTFGSFGSEVRSNLEHGGSEPGPREVRRAEGQAGAKLRFVALGERELAIQPDASSGWRVPSATVHVDNPYEDPIAVRVDGAVVESALPPGELLTLRLPEGAGRQIEALGRGGVRRDEVRATIARTRTYVFAPGGRRELILKGDDRGYRPGVRMRGLAFVDVPDGIGFEPDGEMRRGETGDLREAVKRDLAALVAEAKAGLAPEKLAEWRRRLPRPPREGPSDLDLLLGRALLADLREEAAAADLDYGAALTFGPGSAAVHRVVGTSYSRRKEWALAATSLERALELEPSWEAELRPLLEEARKGAEAKRAEDERQLRESAGEGGE